MRWWIFLNTWERCFFSVCNTGGSEQNNWVLPTRSCCFAFQLLKACNKALKSNKFELYKKMSLVAQHFSELYMHDVRLLGICTISLNFLSTLQWQIQGRARGPPPLPPPPLIFRPNWGPKGRKNWGGDQSPRRPPPPLLLSKGLDDRLHLISRSGSGTALVHLECNSILDILWSLVRAWTMWFTSIFCYVTLPWQQYIWISQNRGPAKMAEKTDMYDFPAHDCT